MGVGSSPTPKNHESIFSTFQAKKWLLVWKWILFTGIMTIKSKYLGIDPQRARLGGFICHMGFPTDRELG